MGDGRDSAGEAVAFRFPLASVCGKLNGGGRQASLKGKARPSMGRRAELTVTDTPPVTVALGRRPATTRPPFLFWPYLWHIQTSNREL